MPTTAILVCPTCNLEIANRPVVDAGVGFCCAGCAAGGPCTCADRLGSVSAARDDEIRYCLDVRAAVGSAWPPVRED